MTTRFSARHSITAMRTAGLAGAALAGITLLGINLHPNPLHAASMTGPLSNEGGPLAGPAPGAGLPIEPLPGATGTPADLTPSPIAVPKKPLYSETDSPILLSVGDLADFCASKPSEADGIAKRNICAGFILGVIAVAERQQASGGARLFCTPKPTFDLNETMDQLSQMAQTRPAVRSSPVIDGLALFLQARFPCK